MRFLLGLSFGIIVGAGGIIALLVSGTGDFFLASSPRMQALETELRQVQREREFAVKQLELRLDEAAARDEKMAESFDNLRDSFARLASDGAKAKRDRDPSAEPTQEAMPPGAVE